VPIKSNTFLLLRISKAKIEFLRKHLPQALNLKAANDFENLVWLLYQGKQRKKLHEPNHATF